MKTEPMNYTPIYYPSGSAARDAGQLDAYRASYAANVATRSAIDDAIREYFDGMRLAPDALHYVLWYVQDADRVALVLANTLRWRDHDGRFSRASRSWAAGVRLPDAGNMDAYDSSSAYACASHSAILEGFIQQFIRYQKEATL